MSDDAEDDDAGKTIVERDRDQATRDAFAAGRYYKDSNGNWSIKPKDYKGPTSADYVKSRGEKWYGKKD